MCCSIVFVEGSGTKVRWLYSLADDVCFSDPGALGVREDDGNDVPGCLEGLHEGLHVGGGLV
jgi:hypothetical protein